jgi:TubC N-terminal docking domain
MGAPDVLGRLAAASIRLRADGERLFAEPREALTDELRSAIRANKPALLTALVTPCPDDLRTRIWEMAQRWGYSPDELAYALQKAAEDPIAWRDFVNDDERWCATRH